MPVTSEPRQIAAVLHERTSGRESRGPLWRSGSSDHDAHTDLGVRATRGSVDSSRRPLGSLPRRLGRQRRALSLPPQRSTERVPKRRACWTRAATTKFARRFCWTISQRSRRQPFDSSSRICRKPSRVPLGGFRLACGQPDVPCTCHFEPSVNFRANTTKQHCRRGGSDPIPHRASHHVRVDCGRAGPTL
jgi:hypothetical protein